MKPKYSLNILLLVCCSLAFKLDYARSGLIKPRRIAIVFGMSKYQFASTIDNTLNDADDIKTTLQKDLNFEVYEYLDLNLSAMKSMISNWGAKLNNYDIALFYFSGHGAEVKGVNYLFPIDANPVVQADVPDMAYSVQKIMEILDDAKVNTKIVVLDACRDNPFTKSFTKSFGTEGGLNVINLNTPGTFIGFAASPGHVAYPLKGRNAPFTQAILKYINKPNLTIDQIFNKVNFEVRILTNGDQLPWHNSSLEGDFYFLLSNDPNEVTKSFAPNLENYNKLTLAKIKSLLNVIPFGSSISDVIAYEYGEKYRNSVEYKTLPQSGECTNNDIRYYWRPISESKLKTSIYLYLDQNNLNAAITKTSYILYVFNKNRLIRIQLRLTYDDILTHNKIEDLFGIDRQLYPSRFIYKASDIFGAIYLEENQNMTNILLGDINELASCNNDWWTK